MGDRLKQIPQQLLEFWGRFSSKQKAVIIGIILAVIVTAIIFVVIFTRTSYTQIAKYEKTADTAAAKNVLEEQAIKYQVSDDGLTLSVDSARVAEARVALGENSVGAESTTGYTYAWAFDNSISTTSTERTEKLKLAIQTGLAEDIVKVQKGVDTANVQITFADDSTAILETESVNTIAAMLTINDNFKSEAAKGIATFLATAIGNTDTDNIKIIDQDGNILFAGDTDSNGSTTLASAQEYKADLTNGIKTQVQALLLKASNYNDVEVAPNMAVNFDKSTRTDEHYYTDDDQETGPKAYDYSYKNKNNSDGGNVVGTDANDGKVTDYDITNGANSSGETTILKNEYNTSKETTITEAGAASVDYNNSSISVVLNRYHSYYEKDLEQELKDNDQTFEEFKLANGNAIPLDVDESLITSVAMATGISEDNISILAYEKPLFYDKESASVATMAKNYLQYILALIILALLAFVVFKGMKPVEVEEMEPELSVEALLATTKDNQGLDNIEFSDKSATREQIEKFVDENPEAVAQLLRNWLNEDWE